MDELSRKLDAALAESYSKTLNKLDQVAAASAEKVRGLEQYRISVEQKRAENADSWASKLGLDEFQDPVLHTTVNSVAAAVNATGDVVSNIGGAVRQARGGALAMNIPDEVRAARARQLEGKATQSDLDILALPEGDTKPGQWKTPFQRQAAQGARTNLERIQEWEGEQQAIRDIKTSLDAKSIVDHRPGERLQRQLAQDAEAFKADLLRGDYLTTAGKAAASVVNRGMQNPGAVVEGIASQAPQLLGAAAGPLGMALTNGGYAANVFNEGVLARMDKSHGAMPTKDEMGTIIDRALDAGAMEQIGDMLTLGAGKVFKGAAGLTGKTAGAVLNNPATRLAGTGAMGAASEYLTEAVQTYEEEAAKGKDVSLAQLHTGGAMGALAGGPMSTAFDVLGAAPDAVDKAGAFASKKKKELDAAKAERDATKAATLAAESGDVSALLDKDSPTFNPVAAIGALHTLAAKEGVSPEQKQQHVAKAEEALSTLEAAVTQKQQVLDESKQQQQAVISQIKEAIAATDPAKTDKLKRLQDLLSAAEQSTGIAEAEVGLSQAKTDLTKAQKVHQALVGDTGKSQQEAVAALKPEDIEAKVVAANQDVSTATDPAVTQAASEAAHEVISLAMTSPGKFTPEKLQELADNTSNAFTDDQRSVLRKLSAQKRKILETQTLEGVSQDVIHGNPTTRMMGLNNYQTAIGQAIGANSLKTANRFLGLLDKFQASHTEKAALVSDAFKRARANNLFYGQGIQIVKTNDGWQETSGLTPEELSENGGLEIHQNSGKVVKAVRAEAAAINSTRDALGDAVSLAFSKKTAPVEAKAEAVPEQPAQAKVQDVVPEKTQEKKKDTAPEPEPTQEQKPADSPVNQAEVPTETTPKAEANPAEAKLSVFSKRTPGQSVPHQLKNLVADTLRQVADKTKPLTQFKDFLSKLRNQELAEGTVEKFSGIEEFSNNQESMIYLVSQVQTKLVEVLGSLLPSANLPQEYKYQNPVQFLVDQGTDGKPLLEENVVTAMAVAVVKAAADMASSPLSLKPKEVPGLFGMKDTVRVSRELVQRVQGSAGNWDVAAADLGREITDLLGIKDTGASTEETLPNLQASLGQVALEAMQEMGLVKLLQIPMGEFAYDFQSLGLTEEALKGKASLVLPVRKAGKGVSVTLVAKMLAKTHGVLDKLFGATSTVRGPSLEKPTFTQKTLKGTQDAVPANLAEAISKDMQIPWFVRPEMHSLYNALSRADLLEMFGWTDPGLAQGTQRDGVTAYNTALENDFDTMLEYVNGVLLEQETKLDTPIYYTQEVWRNQRVGYVGALMNPQTSKVARHLVGRKEWESTIHLDNQHELNQLKLGILEGFGVKTERDLTQNILDKNWDAFANREDVKAAVAALVSWGQHQRMEGEQIQALKTVVTEAGEGAHTLAALQALAELRIAEAEGKSSFVTRLTREVDGVTNGPVLSQFVFGVPEGNTNLESGGIYPVGGKYQSYSQFRNDPLNKDLYESTSSKVIAAVQASISPQAGNTDVAQAVATFLGALTKEDGSVTSAGRKLVKRSIAAIFFGSGMTAAAKGIASDFTERVLDTVAKTHAKGNAADTQALVAQINLLMRTGFDYNNYLHSEKSLKHKAISYGRSSVDSFLLKPGTTAEGLFDHVFTLQQQDLLTQGFLALYESSIEYAIESQFGDYLTKRDAVVTVLNGAGSIYNSVYSVLQSAMTEQNAIHGLSKDQRRRIETILEDMYPRMATANSLISKEPDTGISVFAGERKLSNSRGFGGEARFGSTETGNAARTSNFRALGTERITSGVSVVSQGTHSMDSGVSQQASRIDHGLNIHDARVSGVLGSANSAYALNTAVVDLATEYSPALEAALTLEKTLKGLQSLLASMPQDSGIKAKVLAAVEGVLEEQAKGQPKDTSVSTATMAALSVLSQAHADRLKTLANTAVVDQYAFEGQGYVLTDAQRQGFAQQHAAYLNQQEGMLLDWLAAVANATETEEVSTEATETKVSEVTQKWADAMDAKDVWHGLEALSRNDAAGIQKARAEAALQAMVLGKSLGEAIQDLTPKQQANFIRALQGAIDTYNQMDWGTQGTPTTPQDSALVQFWEAAKAGDKTADDLVTFLQDYLKTNGAETSKMYQYLLGLVAPLVAGQGVKLVYVTPTTQLKQVIGSKPEADAVGWFNQDRQGKKAIHVLSAEYQQAKITPELMLHELLHAALAAAIQSARNKGNQDTEAREFLNNISHLMKLSREFMAAQAITDFAAAVSNEDEFISYGLTNPEFQKQVLTQVQVDLKLFPANRMAKFANGLKAFIQAVGNFLTFTDKKRTNAAGRDVGKTYDALSLLVMNVQGFIGAKDGVKMGKAAISKASTGGTAQPFQSFDMGTDEMFDALVGKQAVSPKFAAKIKGYLSSITAMVYSDLGAFKATVKAQNQTALDTWEEALLTGKAPYASSLIASGFNLTEQELFVAEQIEATLRTAMDAEETSTRMAYTALQKAFQEARSTLKPESFYKGDWSSAPPAERTQAKQRYDFIFSPTAVHGAGAKLDYLSRFAALALASESFNTMLQFEMKQETRPTGTVIQKLEAVLKMVVGWFTDKLLHIRPGEPAAARIETLVKTLAKIEGRKRDMLLASADDHWAAKTTQKGVDVVGNVATYIKAKIAELADSKWGMGSKRTVLKLAGTVGSVYAHGHVMETMEVIRDIGQKAAKFVPDTATQLMAYTVGFGAMVDSLVRANKNIEKVREDLIVGVAKNIRNAFHNEGKSLSKEQDAAISAVALRTGMYALLDTHSLQDIEKMLRDPKAIEAALLAEKQKLAGISQDRYWFYVQQARDLGRFKATGYLNNPFQLFNAGNIAHMLGTTQAKQVNQASVDQVAPVIERMVVLQALLEMGQNSKTLVADVMATEAQRNGPNGMEYTLKFHKAQMEEAAKKTFAGNEALMMHGYLPEALHPRIETILAYSAQEIQDAEAQGYKAVRSLPQDSRDPDAGNAPLMMVRESAGLPQFVTAAMSMTNMEAKGSKQFHVWSKNNSRVTQLGKVAANQMKRPTSFTGENFMAPVLNNQGEVSDWRYMMPESTKDDLLQRNNDFAHLLGMMAGQTFDKAEGQSQNKKVVQELHQIYRKEFGLRPDQFVRVTVDSPDPAIRELAIRLPDHTKKQIDETFGEGGIWVPKELLNPIFGYAMPSLGDVFLKDPDVRSFLEGALVTVVEGALEHYGKFTKGMTDAQAKQYAKRAEQLVRKSENVWKALVKEIKDIIVIRSIKVMYGNIKSNVLYLIARRVPIKKGMEWHKEAYKGITKYQQDLDAWRELDAQIKMGYARDMDKAKADLAILANELERNPVKPLVDAGLMPTIGEDLAQDTNPYSLRNQFMEWAGGKTAWMNPMVKEGIKQAYMGKGSYMHRGLGHITQMSDFVARYALYKHLTTRKDNPMTHDEAIFDVSEGFVNYDLPLPKKIQWADDMGLLMFTKYFFSIQRRLVRLMKDHPGEAVMNLMAVEFMGAQDTIMNSAAPLHVGNNPLKSGAFQYFGTLDKIPTISLLK